MTTPITSFNRKECELIPGIKVNAYVDIALDPENPTGIILSSTWGEVHLDIKSIVKAGETVTHLELAPADEPTVLKYTREDGEVDCITGDELSRIISLALLKDVDQTVGWSDGDILIYQDGNFTSFNLSAFIDTVNNFITNTNARLQQLGNRISGIEDIIYNYPADKTTKIPRGTLNIYGDASNTGSHADGIFSHDPNTDEVNDLYFS